MNILGYAGVLTGLMLVLSAGMISNNVPATAARAKATEITVDEMPTTVRPGDKFTFTGMLTTTDGEPLNQVPVNIYILTSDPQLIVVASGVTGIEGTYEIEWDVKLVPMDRPAYDLTESFDSQVVSMFAQFEGDESYAPSKTSKSTVTIEVNSIKTFVNSDKRLYKEGESAKVFVGFVDSDDQFVDPDSMNVNFNVTPVGDQLEKKKVGSYTFTTPPLEKGHNQFSVVPSKAGYNIQTEVITITVEITGSQGIFGGK